MQTEETENKSWYFINVFSIQNNFRCTGTCYTNKIKTKPSKSFKEGNF